MALALLSGTGNVNSGPAAFRKACDDVVNHDASSVGGREAAAKITMKRVRGLPGDVTKERRQP